MECHLYYVGGLRACQWGGSAVESKVTQGVIICDVETDMASYHTHSQMHTPTFIWSLVHKCMTPTMCVSVCVY